MLVNEFLHVVLDEHQRQLEAERGYTASEDGKGAAATFNPFADLKSLKD